jgi:hypothetical protein
MPSSIADSTAVRTQICALRLYANPAEPMAVGGRIEHVLSGHCVSFDSAAALPAGILKLQRQALVGTVAASRSTVPG